YYWPAPKSVRCRDRSCLPRSRSPGLRAGRRQAAGHRPDSHLCRTGQQTHWRPSVSILVCLEGKFRAKHVGFSLYARLPYVTRGITELAADSRLAESTGPSGVGEEWNATEVSMNTHRSAVVLSGGGAYAAYEVGVLKALAEGNCPATEGIPI